MFHRVKPEAQQDIQESRAPAATEAPEKAEAPRQPYQQKPAAEQQRTERPAEAKPAIQQTQQQSSPFKQEKDSKPMTADNKDFDDSNDQPAQQQPAARTLDIPAGAYQRPGQAPVRSIGGYPGAYPGAASYSPHRPEAASQTAQQRTLTIGSGITMSGEIESCDYLLVEGTVEAALKGASVLEIAESGVFYGTVEIDEATIAGRFEGDITVNGRLTIRSSGTITGSIAYKELEVESGAVVDGRLTPVSAVQAANKGSAKNKQQQNSAPKAKSSKEDQSPANSDGELFSSKAAAE